jgi:acyl-CoA reductase-like NAD-dependent aldehyde dehydrogenase
VDEITAQAQKTRLKSELFINGKWVEGEGQAAFSVTVLCVTSYADLDEAIGMANDSDYGLASYVWSDDIRESHRIAQELEAGNVFLNAYGYQSEIPFGGYKMSGIGREHGTEAMHEYTQLKSVTVGMERFKSRFEI